jgi:hypothetical protein
VACCDLFIQCQQDEEVVEIHAMTAVSQCF